MTGNGPVELNGLKENPVSDCRFPARTIACIAFACAAWVPSAALAERWFFSGSIDGSLTATDNANFDDRSAKQSDVVINLTPRVGMRGEGGRLRLNGAVALSTYTYANGSQSSRIVPSGDLGLFLEAIERMFFVESSLRVERGLDSPFGPQVAEGSRINTADRYQARISPYFAGAIGSRGRYQLRHDSSWIRSSGGTSTLDSQGNQYAHHQLGELTLIPSPFGASLTYDRDQSNTVDGSPGRRTAEIARLILTFGSEPQFVFGLRAGKEKNDYPGFNSDRQFFGASVTWRPTERTNLSVVGEKRFFGDSWQASFDHRMPRLAWSLRSSRGVSTLPQRLLSLSPGLDVAALIDASLTTRIPDPIARARAVEDLIISRGLPRTLLSPVDIFSDRIEIQAINTGTVTLLGARNSLALTVFQTRTEGLDSAIAGSPPSSSLLDNRQRGAALSFAHQFSPRTNVNAETSWRQTRGLGLLTEENTRQQTYQLRISRLLTPKTTALAGVRYQVFDSTIERDTTETAVFVALGHRF